MQDTAKQKVLDENNAQWVVGGQLQASPRHQRGRTYVSQKTLLYNISVKCVDILKILAC